MYIRFFDSIGIDDVPLVGGKNASLGEMARAFGDIVPNGFAITARAYTDALERSGAIDDLRRVLEGLDAERADDLARRGAEARRIVYAAPLAEGLEDEMRAAYARLRGQYGEGLSLAVRSSATAEDMPTASFAGQLESFLNVQGDAELVDAVRRCFASLFTDRAIHYRIDKGFDHFKIAVSVGVMKMVRADRAASGVMFTLDPETGFRDVVLVSAAHGLGENVVKGAIDPDDFYVFKPTFLAGKRAVLRRVLGSKRLKMVYRGGGAPDATMNVPTTAEEQARFCIADAEVLQLADHAIRIERHYSERAGHPMPMDIEWAKDGIDGRLYIVQARPETVESQAVRELLEEYVLHARSDVLASGRAVGTRVGAGKARVIASAADMGSFEAGEVLVTDSTAPDWEPIMKRAAAIVTNRGGRTCHAAIVARELGIPAVIGAGNATDRIAPGVPVTVSCAEGDVGKVYAGSLPFEVKRTDLGAIPRPATHIMLILANPDVAFKMSRLPNDGVGLARMEFVIAESIRVHPMALVHPERVADRAEREEIARLTRGFADPTEYFVQRLAEGVGTIAAAFYPKPVIVRMSDFKTNEYAGLLGGRAFEPREENPMIGFRGAARYTHPAYAEGFALECRAMRRVREDFGLTNLKLMIPFCRRVEEGERTIRRMRELGLARGVNGLEIYVMCEIPNNVLSIDEFAQHFDGFSIGSNDLTQLVLGVDRDSEIVAFDFDERDPGVQRALQLAVEGCRRNLRHSGICGEAPSNYPEIAAFLVRLGIDSISLNPDAVLATTRKVLELEASLGRAPRVQPGRRLGMDDVP